MIELSKDLKLPDEAVTQTFAILAKRGVGKTYTASVMVEEMLQNNLHVVVVDPIGVWWGLRTSADGKSPGFPVIVAGGEHGDVPLESTSGNLIADLVVDRNLSIVIDLSLMRKGEQKRFMIDFAETLYHKNREALHLVLDEADEFAPQRPMGDDARMLGAIEDIVRRGRARGIGVTLITQRPAVLNKNVLTQIEVLVAMRLTSPQDRSALNEWVKYHADSESSNEMITSLPTLPVGTAWFWSPGWLDIFKKVQIRKRHTLDSSSTPKVGGKAVRPTKLADVDIEELKTQLAATIEKAEADDPKLLRRRIVELEKQLADRKPEIEIKEVPVIKDEQIEKMTITATELGGYLKEFTAALGVKLFSEHESFQYQTATPRTNKITPVTTADIRPQSQISDDKVGSGEMKILIAIAQHQDGVTRQQLTVLTGYKQSSRNTYLQRLSQRNLIDSSTGRIIITDEGKVFLGDNYEPLPTGSELRNHLINTLPVGESAILQKLLLAYPQYLTRDQISEETGYAASSRNTYLQRMSSREIIDIQGQNIKVSDMLFREGK